MSRESGPGIDLPLWLGREAEEAAPWVLALAAAGRRMVRTLTMVARRPCSLSAAQRARLAALGEDDAIFLTSVSAVELLLNLEEGRRGAARAFLAAVGPATAHALEAPREGWEGRGPDLLAHPTTGAGLGRAFLGLEERPAGALIYFGAAAPHPALGEVLAASGLELERIAAYRVEGIPGERPARGEPILLFAPSGVHSLAQRAEDPEHHPVLAIGPSTAAAAREYGFPVRATLAQPTPESLVEELDRP